MLMEEQGSVAKERAGACCSARSDPEPGVHPVFVGCLIGCSIAFSFTRLTCAHKAVRLLEKASETIEIQLG